MRLCWLEVGMAYDRLLMHAPRPPIDAWIETAPELAPGRGACDGLTEAA
jgi:hypothetical protein